MFKTRYSARTPSEGIIFTDPSLTLQSEYRQTTIDFYLKKYSATGVLGDPVRQQQARFEDVSEVRDFQEQQNNVLKVKAAFMELPAEERRKYGDDPAIWIQAKIAEADQAQLAQLREQEKLAEEAAKQAASSEKAGPQGSQAE